MGTDAFEIRRPGQSSCDSSWSSLASQVQQTDIIRLPLLWCSGFLGKYDPWPHFHLAYHSTLGQDLLNHSVMKPPLSTGPKYGVFSDPSQSLSDWKILLRDNMVPFLWDLGLCGSSIEYDEFLLPQIKHNECSQILLLLNIWADRSMGTKIKVNHFKFRGALNKANRNFTHF